MNRVKNRRGAQIVAGNGQIAWEEPAVAWRLVRAGLAILQFKKPLIVKLITIKRIGSARIPDNCKNFIEEYMALSGYFYDNQHRTRKPRNSVEKIEVEDGYVPLPFDFGR